MGLLDGGLASAFGAAFGSFYLDGTLLRAATYAADAGGTITSSSPTSIPCKVQVDAISERLRASPGFTDAEVRIFVLASSLSGDVTSDDRIQVATGPYAGVSWKLNAPIGRDPAGCYWDCAGVRA